jgi:hypothetical protein
MSIKLTMLRTFWNVSNFINGVVSPNSSSTIANELISPRDSVPTNNYLALPFASTSNDTKSSIRHRSSSNCRDLIDIPIKSSNNNVPGARGTTPFTENSRTRLRIFRQSNERIGPDQAGRIVIFGRMQDVCAEVDRLSAAAGQQ